MALSDSSVTARAASTLRELLIDNCEETDLITTLFLWRSCTFSQPRLRTKRAHVAVRITAVASFRRAAVRVRNTESYSSRAKTRTTAPRLANEWLSSICLRIAYAYRSFRSAELVRSEQARCGNREERKTCLVSPSPPERTKH